MSRRTRGSRIATTTPATPAAKRYRVGCLDWHGQRVDLPPGPADIPSLFSWPDAVVEVLCKARPEMRTRLQDHASCGVTLHSQYSGKGTAESAFCKVGQGLAAARLMAAQTPAWNVATAADNKKIAQPVLVSYADRSKPSHVFGDLNDMLAPGMRNELARLRDATRC